MTASGRHSSYERFPYIPSGPRRECAAGWDAICAALGGSGARVVVVDAYTGVAGSDLLSLVKGLDPELSIPAGDALRSPEEIERMLHPYVTDDPVFGRIAELGLLDLFDPHRLRLLREEIEACEGRVVVYGAGASLLADGDVLVYADMPRREEVLRQRRHESAPLGASRPRDDPALAYKRSFFVDWRICDAHRRALLGRADHVLDTTAAGAPKMIEGRTLLRSLHDLARRPFRVVPFFDPAPWGGRWLMEVCDLDRDAVNYGWAFDCVPEENSLLLGFGDARFETPALNLVHQAQEPLLGPHVLETFGAEFPIRFDFLDTMEGGNLSLQVHPTSRYIGETFGMRYTQDESYYLMDAAPDAGVYLGLRRRVEPSEMMEDLRRAAAGSRRFPDERYIARRPAGRHDHFLIPAGTVHCSGANAVVLEISATPYIFTFKLWDWGRLGLDGRPRPLHLDHGERSIQWDRDEAFVEENLVNRVEEIDAGDGWREERTGLHELQFIETRRHWFGGPVAHHTQDTVNVLNLVEGEEAIVESPDGSFEPFAVHYAETFIVPAAVGRYTIRPWGRAAGRECATIKAFVRPGS